MRSDRVGAAEVNEKEVGPALEMSDHGQVDHQGEGLDESEPSLERDRQQPHEDGLNRESDGHGEGTGGHRQPTPCRGCLFKLRHHGVDLFGAARHPFRQLGPHGLEAQRRRGQRQGGVSGQDQEQRCEPWVAVPDDLEALPRRREEPEQRLDPGVPAL